MCERRDGRSRHYDRHDAADVGPAAVSEQAAVNQSDEAHLLDGDIPLEHLGGQRNVPRRDGALQPTDTLNG